MTPRKTEGAPPAKVSAPPYAKRPNKQKIIPPPTAEQEQIGTPRKPVKNSRREEILHAMTTLTFAGRALVRADRIKHSSRLADALYAYRRLHDAVSLLRDEEARK